MAQWRNQLGESDPNGTKPPVCLASITFLGLELKTQMPFIVIFHGSSLPIIKSFLRVINYKREQSRRQGNDLQMYHFALTISLKQQTTAKGKYFVPVFEKKEEITDPKERAMLCSCYEHLCDRFQSEPLEDTNEN